MRVLVLGATGGTGLCLVQQALEQELTITAFARRAFGSATQRLRVIQGDVLEPAQVEAAVVGHDVVLWAIGARPWKRAARHVCSDGTRNLVAAMKAAGVRRLVCESAFGVGDSKAGGPYARILRLLLRVRVLDKEGQEQIIRTSELEWIIVRPTILTSGPKTGRYRAGPNLRAGVLPRISRADVADFMLKQLRDNTYLRKAVAITY